MRRIFAVHIVKTERAEEMIFIRDRRKIAKQFKIGEGDQLFVATIDAFHQDIVVGIVCH